MRGKAKFNLIIAGLFIVWGLAFWITNFQRMKISTPTISYKLFIVVLSLVHVFFAYCSISFLKTHRKLEKIIKMQFIGSIFLVLSMIYAMIVSFPNLDDFVSAFAMGVFVLFPMTILNLIGIILGVISIFLFIRTSSLMPKP